MKVRNGYKITHNIFTTRQEARGSCKRNGLDFATESTNKKYNLIKKKKKGGNKSWRILSSLEA